MDKYVFVLDVETNEGTEQVRLHVLSNASLSDSDMETDHETQINEKLQSYCDNNGLELVAWDYSQYWLEE